MLSFYDILKRKRLRVDFIELHILHHAGEEPLYGLWMIEELSRHGYAVGASQLYPKFRRLQQAGYLTQKNRIVGGKVRKYYRLTSDGKKYLREQKDRLIELCSEALSLDEIRSLLEEKIAATRKSGGR